MTVNDVITYAQQISQTDSNSLTSTLGLAYTNDALENFTRVLLTKNINAAQTQEAYTNIQANQGSYAWPTNMFMLKTVEVNYQDSSQQNSRQAQIVDVSNLQNGMSFDFLRTNQSTQNPEYTNYGDTFEIFPTPTAAVGFIRIFYFLTPSEYSSVNSTIVYPQSLDYRCLSERVAALYLRSVERYDEAAQHESAYQIRLNDIIRILAPGTEQPITPQGLGLTGFEF